MALALGGNFDIGYVHGLYGIKSKDVIMALALGGNFDIVYRIVHVDRLFQFFSYSCHFECFWLYYPLYHTPPAIYPHTGSANPRVHNNEPMITTKNPSATSTLALPYRYAWRR